MNRYGFLVIDEQHNPSIWLITIVDQHKIKDSLQITLAAYQRRKGNLERVLCQVQQIVWAIGNIPPSNPDRGEVGKILNFSKDQVVFTIEELRERVTRIKAQQIEHKKQIRYMAMQEVARASEAFVAADDAYERIKNASFELDTEITELVESSKLNELFEEMEKEKWL